MDLGIRNRVALVTGASAGLGKAVALGLAAEGVRLAIAARSRERLGDVVQAARDAGAADARAFPVDLTDPDAPSRLVDGVRAGFGDAEILVLNGPGPKPGGFSSLDLPAWDTAYAGVLRNMLALVYAAVPAMRRNGWGRIVALTSSTVRQPAPNLTLSNAFRTALVAALKTLSDEVARDGITVNAIATGRVVTDRLRALYGSEDEIRTRAEQEIPAGRAATPQEFAPMPVFLCGEPAKYVTGTTIAVDGGLLRSVF